MDEFEGFEETGESIYLEECNSCGRKFNFDSLERHEKICSKVKKRKPFDARQQRIRGLGLEKIAKAPQQKKLITPKKGDWRRKHDSFISTIRAARGVTAAIKSGGPLPPPPPAEVDPDYVQCPHCERNFNIHVAERHMPFCKEQKARITHNNLGPSAARSKQNKRIQYRPPLPGRRDTANAETTSLVKPKAVRSADSNGRYGSTENLRSIPVSTKASSLPVKSSPQSMLNGGKANQYGRSPGAGQRGATERSKQRVSSGSSASDSEHSLRNNSKKEPQWYEDMMKAKARPSPQHQPASSEAERYTDARIDENDGDHGTERRVHSGRRRADQHANATTEQFTSPPDTRQVAATAVGVVRPSSRHSPSPPVYPQRDERKPNPGRSKMANFCHECGTKYPVDSARFCCECGMKRVQIGR